MHTDQGLIDETFGRQRAELAALLEQLHSLAEAAGSGDLLPVIDQLGVTIGEPFLFVVVGEIKAGKSSFINALLGAEVCRVDPAPCTDVIQEIVWAPEAVETEIAPHLRRIGVPAEILKDIAIVDTPGTNTIIEHHQEITQRFIPNSGLVIFVFPAKNPHTRSAWQLLESVSDEWRKRVVFVLQQADLATEAEMTVNTAKVMEYARDRGIGEPEIFATSAKRELAGQPESGFDSMRRFIRGTVTGGRHLFLKLRATLDTSESLFDKIGVALAEARHQLEADRRRSQELTTRLEDRRKRSLEQGSALVREVLERFDGCGEAAYRKFDDGLAVPTFFRRSVGAALGRRGGMAGWMARLQEEFETCLDKETDAALNSSGRRILTDVEDFLREIAASLTEMSGSAQRPEAPVIDFWQRRDAMIEELQRNLADLRPETLFSEKLAQSPERAGSTLVSGGAMTLVGALLLATTHITVLDVTGGLLTGAGLLLTGGALVTRRGRMRREFRENLQTGRVRLGEALETRLNEEINAIYHRISQRLNPFLQYVNERMEALDRVHAQGKHLGEAFRRLSAEVDRAAGGGEQKPGH
ncbi:MAG: dynamin family protein [Desulfobacterales bacterium]|jgi:GTPase SAR1 family protein|nr:dynamin family protein [Desulfobacteraceae bacterium]MDY0310648.1 dynamin family protein [Desulfobacterales bacterium]